MDPATIALIEQIGSVLFQAIKLGIQYGPQLLADLEAVWGLIMSGSTLTPDQIATAEANVQAAHAQLQAKIAADTAETPEASG